MKVLTRDQIIKLHTLLIEDSGGSDGLHDKGMLDSALNAPFQTFDGIDLYPTVTEKAVRLGYGLIANHPFIDGNKRIGTHAMLVTLDINGISLEYEDQELIDIILEVAAGNADEQSLLKWIQKHII